jgi:glycosyltransferase involved in cell wall biosynthesis
MKVLHIIAGDLSGGAARGAYWLHRALKEQGVESVIFTNSRTTNGDPDVYLSESGRLSQLRDLLRRQVDPLATAFYFRKIKRIFSTGLAGVDFTKHEKYKDADIVHLHWINAGFVNTKHLAKVDKPMLWTVRDMWPMTGGCHYSMDCESYQVGCGKCPQLNSGTKYDISKFVFRRKQKFIPVATRVVGISSWITEKASMSRMFDGFDTRTISNCIDVEEFVPVDRQVARELLGIVTEKKVILTGSADSSEPWKGFDKYYEALRCLDVSEYYLCFFGRLDESEIKKLGFEYTNFGMLNDNISLRLIYSSADMFVLPSVMEAFGKTLTEAMACGTPVVCFDATGPKDIVSHKVDGYKATPFDSTSLAEGIAWVADAPNSSELSISARRKVMERFDSKIVAEKYLQLYTEMLVGSDKG